MVQFGRIIKPFNSPTEKSTLKRASSVHFPNILSTFFVSPVLSEGIWREVGWGRWEGKKMLWIETVLL